MTLARVKIGDRVRLRAGVLPKVAGGGREGTIRSLWIPREGHVIPPSQYVEAIRLGWCESISEGNGARILTVVEITPEDGLSAPLQAVLGLRDLDLISDERGRKDVR